MVLCPFYLQKKNPINSLHHHRTHYLPYDRLHYYDHHHYCPLLHFFIRSRTRGRRTWRPESIRLEPDPLVDTRRSAREPSDRLGNVAMTLSPVPFPCYDSRPMKALKEYNQYSWASFQFVFASLKISLSLPSYDGIRFLVGFTGTHECSMA